ncbi:DUF368 domain-containing protein [Bacillus piscicola]|uniref:DUF368 domain-containing protein n=1 Tax=Bacillus piscicola TaxID=1632684 RepID=UPI001F08AD9E|nr:DUF368 domain-containing protein [Bacillus piscicola]
MLEWKNILRGLAMGASDLVPGVSGGTIALVLGIYDRLIKTINEFFSRKWKEQLGFLIPLAVGMGIAIFSLSNLLKWLLADYPQPTFFFFIGLILGTIPFLLRKADYKRQFQGYHYIIFTAAAAVIILSGVFRAEETGQAITTLSASDYMFLFLAGWVASSAMILPGISGSFVLLLLGVYDTILQAVSSLNFGILLTVGVGVVVGIVVMSKFLHYLLRSHPTGIYAVMSGLLFGSLFVIFPGIPADASLVTISAVTFLAGLAIAMILGKIEEN